MYMKEIIVAHTHKRILSDKMLYLHAFSLHCLSKFYVFYMNNLYCTAQNVTLNEHRATIDL